MLGMGLGMDASVVIGLICVMIGLVLFMDGLRYGIMPLGESIGMLLPRHFSTKSILLVRRATDSLLSRVIPILNAFCCDRWLGYLVWV